MQRSETVQGKVHHRRGTERGQNERAEREREKLNPERHVEGSDAAARRANAPAQCAAEKRDAIEECEERRHGSEEGDSEKREVSVRSMTWQTDARENAAAKGGVKIVLRMAQI